MLAVDTAVTLGGRIYGKPQNAEEAVEMLERLSGKTHLVVSGLCLLTPGWEFVDHAATRVTFRPLTPRDIATYVASGEWEGPRGRVRDPGPRRCAGRADRGRLPERRRTARVTARPRARRALRRRLRLRLAQLSSSRMSQRGRWSLRAARLEHDADCEPRRARTSRSCRRTPAVPWIARRPCPPTDVGPRAPARPARARSRSIRRGGPHGPIPRRRVSPDAR